MSDRSITPIAVDLGFEDAQYWSPTVHKKMRKSETSDTADSSECGASVDADLFSHAINVQAYHDRLQVIQDRVTRIVERMTCLNSGLRHMHVGLKQNNKLEWAALPEVELKDAVGDIGCAQAEPPAKPTLNLISERIGDSVACQTVEDNSKTQL